MSDITFPAVVEAIQKAAHKYGVAEMAGQMDMKPSSLYNALNPWGDRGTAKLGLEQALFIMRETGDHSAFLLMAAELGFRAIPREAIPDHPDTREEMLDDNNMLTKFHAAVRNGESLMVVQAKAAATHKDIDETVEQYRRELAKAEFGSVRVIMKDGEPWFVARDVAVALGYADPADAIQRHCKKVNDSNMGVSPSVPSPKIIPESDVYRLVMRSNLPAAIEFQDWICEEVIPSIRRTGGYLIDKPDDTPEVIMARAVLVAQDTIKRLESRNTELEGAVSEMKPKALFADSVASSSSSILVGQLAALIRQNGVNIGQNRLFEWMRGRGYLVSSGSRRNFPTQKSLDMGLFEVKERAINNPDGSVRLTLTTKVTGKGQIYFVNKFMGGVSPEAMV